MIVEISKSKWDAMTELEQIEFEFQMNEVHCVVDIIKDKSEHTGTT